MKKVYYGYWDANNSTGNREPIINTNKQRLIKYLREIAEANCFDKSTCRWSVYDTPFGQVPIAAGGMRNDGSRYRTI